MDNRILFEAVETISRMKELNNELKQRKLEFREYVKKGMSLRKEIPFTEENYHIVFEEAVEYKEKVDSMSKDLAYLQSRNFDLEKENKV
mgnify:CR=1 FL=1